MLEEASESELGPLTLGSSGSPSELRVMYSCSLARRARRSFFSLISALVGMAEDWRRARSEPNLDDTSISVLFNGAMSDCERRSFGVEGVEALSSFKMSAL